MTGETGAAVGGVVMMDCVTVFQMSGSRLDLHATI